MGLDRTYSELMKLKTFDERYEYLKLGTPMDFDSQRYLNQRFYSSQEWRRLRRMVLLRDSIGGYPCDLACEDHPIVGKVIIHHLKPLTISDFKYGASILLDMENLIVVSEFTHKAIHGGNARLIEKDDVPRTPYDTCPWRYSSKWW